MSFDFAKYLRVKPKPGDLVCNLPKSEKWEDIVVWKTEPIETGIVLNVLDDMSTPPMVEIHWTSGYTSKASQDDITVISKAKQGEKDASTC